MASCARTLLIFIAMFFMPRAVLAESGDVDAPAAPTSVTTSADIRLFPIDKLGKPSKEISLLQGEIRHVVAFKYDLKSPWDKYKSWVLEVSSPSEQLLFRVANESHMPLMLHWDGRFNDTDGILPNKTYFARLILVLEGNVIGASQWTPFKTSLRERYIAPNLKRDELRINVIPKGSLEAAYLLSNAGNRLLFPILDVEAGVSLRNQHYFLFRTRVSSNAVFSSDVFYIQPEVALFSEVVLGYRKQLQGRPVQRTLVPFLPEYVDPVLASALRQRHVPDHPDIQLGVKLFRTTLRGISGSQIHSALPHEIIGLLGSFYYSAPITRKFRLRTEIDGGLSLIGGLMVNGNISAALTYEYWSGLSLGLVTGYRIITGTRADGASIFNHLPSGGILVGLKL